MVKGFELKIDTDFFNDKDYTWGIIDYETNKKKSESSIEQYMNSDGSLDGEKMSEEWFPNITADIFISHSHADEKLAIKLAGWLYKNFGLKSFIDSCVWGYSDDLLHNIDNKYCYKKETKTYSYELRNYSTSHVHMMLSTSLVKMIDSVECVIFLNTENSIQSVEDVIKNTTKSPWIFSELEITKVIRKRSVSDYRKEKLEKRAMFESFSMKDLVVRHTTSTTHLTKLDEKRLLEWQLSHLEYKDSHPLDLLYSLSKQKTI